MEGERCYRFGEIARQIADRGLPAVRTAVDVGAHVGNMSLLMAERFPDAQILACEVVPEIFSELVEATRREPRIHPCHCAVVGEWRDDLRLFRSIPDCGRGWRGGSCVAPAGARHKRALHTIEPLDAEVKTFAQILQAARELTGAPEVDVVKFDCEGCEQGCLALTPREELLRVRWIVGEYHRLTTFLAGAIPHLCETHIVTIEGDAGLGRFFAERRAHLCPT